MQGFGEWLATLDWGDVPSWVGGIGTTAAVIVALWQSGRETRKQRKDRERAQAEQVAAWCTGEQMCTGRHNWTEVLVLNRSGLPIYGVRVWGQAESNPEVNPEKDQGAGYVDILPPGEDPTVIRIGFNPDLSVEGTSRAQIAFQDAAGTLWVRDMEGVLHKSSETHSLDVKDPQ